MIETLEQLDHALTLGVNNFNAPIFDLIMTVISAKLTWVPLYLLLLYLFHSMYGWKTTVFILIGVAMTIFLTDQISVFLKNEIGRYRPCHNLNLQSQLSLPSGCGGTYGFVSSHAANTMGLAIYTIMLLRKKWIMLIMLSFAALNSYSRVYLGKHFVSDVVAGMALGAVLGYCVYYCIAKLIELKNAKP